MHSGVTLVAAGGRLASMEILDAAPVKMLAPYPPKRFATN
jgi:hypothetical protein